MNTSENFINEIIMSMSVHLEPAALSILKEILIKQLSHTRKVKLREHSYDTSGTLKEDGLIPLPRPIIATYTCRGCVSPACNSGK